MMTYLEQLLFRDKLVDDVREPIWTFEINNVTWGVLLPSVTFWMQLASLLGILCLYGMMVSTMVYHFIVQQRKKNNKIMSYLFGYGIILPMTLCIPPYLTQLLNIQNMLLRFCVSCVLPALILFRTSEAMYGYLPKHAMTSFSRFVFYFSTTLQYYIINNKDKGDQLQRMSKAKLHSALSKFGMYFLLLSIYYSVFGPYNFEPFSSKPMDANQTWNLWSSDCNILQAYMNNAIGAGLIQLNLSTFCYGIGIISMVATGIDFNVDDAMSNPLLTATSPSDFWGRKWNLIVHSVLKNGVFKPVYNFTYNRPLAVLSCFVASGLFHEWILWCIYRCSDDSGDCSIFVPVYGKQTAFLVWNAIMIFIEALLPRNIGSGIPSFIKTFLTISAALPFAHWFLHSYTKSETRLFQHAQIAFFLIQKIPST